MSDDDLMKTPPTGPGDAALAPISASNLGSPGTGAVAVQARRGSKWSQIRSFGSEQEALEWIDQTVASGPGNLADYRVVPLRSGRRWVMYALIAAFFVFVAAAIIVSLNT